MLGQKEVREDLGILEEKLEPSLLSELQEYKSVFHPIKISILQLVYNNSTISSVEIKDNLEVSWSEYHHAIPSLQKMGYVEIKEDFDINGSKRQFLAITEYGKIEFIRLMKLIDKFMERVKELLPEFDSDLLYPRS